jgi:hypothetical protein
VSTGKLFAAAFVSLLLSLAVYAVLAALLSWWYFAGYLGNPEVTFGPSRLAWMTGLWLDLSYFIAPICLWWLAVFLAEQRRRAPVHRRFARADLWLFLAALLWALLVYAAATKRFLPTEFFNCFEDRPEFVGFTGICRRTGLAYFWAVVGIAVALLLTGLVQRLRQSRVDA